MNTITSSQIRQFNGTIGLLYNNDYDCNGQQELCWTYEDVKQLIIMWQRQQSADNKIGLCIALSNVERLLYVNAGYHIDEPIIRVYGEIVSRHVTLSDEEILNELMELFSYLKKNMKQQSVRFNYQGYTEHLSYRIG
jgi:hypothetical protein